jgi:hypothetical protein
MHKSFVTLAVPTSRVVEGKYYSPHIYNMKAGTIFYEILYLKLKESKYLKHIFQLIHFIKMSPYLYFESLDRTLA